VRQAQFSTEGCWEHGMYFLQEVLSALSGVTASASPPGSPLSPVFQSLVFPLPVPSSCSSCLAPPLPTYHFCPCPQCSLELPPPDRGHRKARQQLLLLLVVYAWPVVGCPGDRRCIDWAEHCLDMANLLNCMLATVSPKCPPWLSALVSPSPGSKRQNL
jgi:hypothetical protein